MSGFEVRYGDTCFVQSGRSAKFLSQPRQTFSVTLNQWVDVLTLQTSPGQYQEFRVIPVQEAEQGASAGGSSLNRDGQRVEVNDRFALELVEGDGDSLKPKRYLHVPQASAQFIGQNPPMFVEAKATEPLTSSHLHWVWQPLLSDGSTSNTIWWYGQEVGILQPDLHEYMRAYPNSPFVVTDFDPGLGSESAEPWVFVPTANLYQCESKQTNACNVTRGLDNTQINLRCDSAHLRQATNTVSPNVDATQVHCWDESGEQVFADQQTCNSHCFTPVWRCTGPPLYRCVADAPTGKPSEFPSYKECLGQCLNPQLQQELPKLQEEAAPRTSVQPQTVWYVVMGVAGLATVGLLIATLVLLFRSK